MSPVAPAAGGRASYGRLAGWLFIGGALLSIPSGLLLEPRAPWGYLLLTGLGVLTGVVCLALDWDRLPRSGFHVVAIVATLELALVVRLVDPMYTYSYLLVGVYVASIYPSWRETMPHAVFVSFAILLPLIYDHETTRETLRLASSAIPIVFVSTAMVTILRWGVERQQRIYAELVRETGETASRIRRVLSTRP